MLDEERWSLNHWTGRMCTSDKFGQKGKEDDFTTEMQNMLETLPNLGTKHLYNLEVLYVISYYSEWISLKILPDSIENLKNLRILDLSYNRLKTLPKSIGNLKNLEKLNLSENFDFSELPDSIGNLENLYTLILKKTNLRSLPESIGNLKNLEELNLSESYNFSELPDSIGNLENLHTLNFKKMNLRSLPESIGNLKNLEELNLSENRKFSELPDFIGNFENLHTLILKQMNLRSLPESIGNLKNLKELNLSDNFNFSELPDFIGNLGNLHTLNLKKMNLRSLPESIGNLKNLEELNLSESYNFSELPDSIGNLKNLYTLSLEQTNLKTLPESLGNLENLTSLSVSWYKESDNDNSDYQSRDAINESLKHWSCPAMEFNDDMKLVSLNLSGKNLKQIPLGVYMLNEKRKYLNSEDGYLYITPELRELDVSNNQLTKIPHLLNKLDQLEKLYIHNNPDLNHLPDFLWKRRNIRKLKIDGKLVKYLPNNAEVSLDDIYFKNKGKISDDQLSNETGPYTVYL
ncbi:RNI-like protein [Anaeromyces robustus]|uniref:RNI-like protein n=1 Tax=Anaeromyces robustus TaxID=1754192 RepID=A0A1Y1XLW1_9FUNG|nr:RNI-like protein [Anaeromyces robustus]|eukprot:ORX86685.1 RNI-like protein [Anaeromyces robustus]